jgi:SAM-dependent methyltransferase
MRVFRSVGLLRLVDRVRFAGLRRRLRASNDAFVAANPDFALPPADLAFDAYGHIDWAGYRTTGEMQAAGIAEVIRTAFPDGPIAVFEWGCGPGRLIRHMPSLLARQDATLAGADYNPRSIAWDREHLPGIDFTVNGLHPPLDQPDGTFDVVYCVSVFTHLSEDVQLAWAAELLRVLKPGGLVLCTTQGDAFRRLLVTADEHTRYASGQVVVLGNYREGRKYFLALHPERFVRERLLAGFAGVRQIQTQAMSYEFFEQDTWVGWKGGVPDERAARIDQLTAG